MWAKGKTIHLIILTFCLSILVGGCRKYEEGPDLSFRSKKNRLFGYWILEKSMLNGIEQTSDYPFNKKFGFAKDGTYYYSFFDPPSGFTINFTGTWEFRLQKEQLVLGLDDPINGMEYQVWDIIRLTSKELWLEMVSPETYVQWYLKAN